MANLQYTVYSDAMATTLGDPIQEGVIAIGATSTQGSAISGSGNLRRPVRIFCEANAYVTWGSNPTATTDGTSGRMFGSENPEVVSIVAGDKIAVIQRV